MVESIPHKIIEVVNHYSEFSAEQNFATFNQEQIADEQQTTSIVPSISKMIDHVRKIETFDHNSAILILNFVRNDFISDITAMQQNRGMISLNDFKKLVHYIAALINSNNPQTNKTVETSIPKIKPNKKVLSSIASMQLGLGMVDEGNFKKLILLCTFNQVLDIDFLSSITSMQNHLGMIKETDFENLVSICSDEKGVDRKLLKTISAIRHQKGMIGDKELLIIRQRFTENNQFRKDDFKIELFDFLSDFKDAETDSNASIEEFASKISIQPRSNQNNANIQGRIAEKTRQQTNTNSNGINLVHSLIIRVNGGR